MKSKFLNYFSQISLVLIISFIYLKTLSNNFDFEIDLAGNNNNLKTSLIFVVSSLIFILICHIFKLSTLKSIFFLFWSMTLILAVFTLLRSIFPSLFYSEIVYMIFSFPILFSIPLVIVPLSGFALFSSETINCIIFVLIPLIFTFLSIDKNKKSFDL